MNASSNRLLSKLPKPEDMMMIYIRVSTQDQKQYGASYEAQEKLLRDYAKSRGKTPKVFGDVCSGATKPEDRAGLCAGLKYLTDGKATSVAVTRIDRLSRSMRHFTEMLGQFDEQGIVSHFLDIGLDTSTPTGKFTLSLFGALAELERNIIKERTKATLDSMREDNRVIGTVPYGKMAIEENGRLVLADNPNELAIMERVKELRECEVANRRGKVAPMTYQAICDQLMVEGFKNREGSDRWFPSSVRHLLPKAAKAVATIGED